MIKFFDNKISLHIAGRKDITNTKKPLEFLQPETVAIPIINTGSTVFDIHVEVGDRVKIGTKLATRADHFNIPLLSSVSGQVIEVIERLHVSSKEVSHIVIKNDFKDEVEHFFAPREDFENITKDETILYMQEYGVLGLGGSGFPSYVKYKNVKDIETVLLNGIECEPYITSDESFAKEATILLFQGLLLMMKASFAKEGVIAIKKGKKALYDTLTSCLKESFSDKPIRVVQIPDAYPMGWERVAITTIFGKSYNMLPSEIGIIVNNSTTAMHLAESIKKGMPMFERIVTMSGEGFANPQNVKVRIGTNLKDVIDAIGGYKFDATSEKSTLGYRLISGGPMMGRSLSTDMVSIGPECNSFLCLKTGEIEEEPCLGCGRCIEYCPAGIQPVQISRAAELKDFVALAQLSATSCVSCGTCSYVCPSNINVSLATTNAKFDLIGYQRSQAQGGA